MLTLTPSHIMLLDLLTDEIVVLAHAAKNVRTISKEEADAACKELKADRKALVERLKAHKTGG